MESNIRSNKLARLTYVTALVTKEDDVERTSNTSATRAVVTECTVNRATPNASIAVAWAVWVPKLVLKLYKAVRPSKPTYASVARKWGINSPQQLALVLEKGRDANIRCNRMSRRAKYHKKRADSALEKMEAMRATHDSHIVKFREILDGNKDGITDGNTEDE